MKKAFAFLMCAMIAFFFTITPAQSKSEVGSDMGIPTICNLECNYIISATNNFQLSPELTEWGRLYRQINVSILCNTKSVEKLNTRFVDAKICHYDPGWQNKYSISKNTHKI